MLSDVSMLSLFPSIFFRMAEKWEKVNDFWAELCKKSDSYVHNAVPEMFYYT